MSVYLSFAHTLSFACGLLPPTTLERRPTVLTHPLEIREWFCVANVLLSPSRMKPPLHRVFP